MKRFLFSLLVTCASVLPAQTDSTPMKYPGEFYPQDRAKVLLVGTFHFNFPGLDEVRTAAENQIDVLEEPKKSEVTDLVNYLKAFGPNRIALEATDAARLNRLLDEYKSGEHRNKRSEVYQVGLRLATELGLDTVYAIDAGSVDNDIYQRDSSLYRSLFNDIDTGAEDPYWEMAKTYFGYREQQLPKVSLIDFFKHLNTREVHNANFGLYLTGSFATGGGQGADRLSMWWYNRNLRIFANLINLTEGPDDRILVLIGNGHAAILRHLIEASPQFELVEFNALDPD